MGWWSIFTFIVLSMFMNRLTIREINIMFNYAHAKGTMALCLKAEIKKLMKKVFYLSFSYSPLSNMAFVAVFFFLKLSTYHFYHERA